MEDKELRKDLIRYGVIREPYDPRLVFCGVKYPLYKDLVEQVKELERKLKAVLELSNIKEVEKGKFLKKGNKEIEY